MALYVNGSRAPSNLYLLDLGTGPGTLRRLTQNLSRDVDPANLVEAEVIRFPSYDRVAVPSLLYRPVKVASGARAPGLLWIHGGPGGQSRVGYNPFVQYLANHGYAVLAVNNRGSGGYGKTFDKLDDQRHGEADLDDLVWAKRYLATLGYVDTSRVAVVGGSYGGYLTLAAGTFPPGAVGAGGGPVRVLELGGTARRIPGGWEAIRQAVYSEEGEQHHGVRHGARVSRQVRENGAAGLRELGLQTDAPHEPRETGIVAHPVVQRLDLQEGHVGVAPLVPPLEPCERAVRVAQRRVRQRHLRRYDVTASHLCLQLAQHTHGFPPVPAPGIRVATDRRFGVWERQRNESGGRNRLAAAVCLQVRPRQLRVYQRVGGVQLQRLAQPGDGLVVAMRVVEHGRPARVEDHGQGIELDRLLHLAQRVCRRSYDDRVPRLEQVRGAVLRVEGDGSGQLLFGRRPIPVVIQADDPERRVRFGERAVEQQRPLRGRLRLGEALPRGVVAPDREHAGGVAQAGVGGGVQGIGPHRLLEVLGTAAQQARLGPQAEEIAAFQVQVVRFRTRRRAPHQGGVGRFSERDLERAYDGPRDFVLHREHVLDVALVLLRPELIATRGVDQLGIHPDAAAGAPHRALEQRRNVQLLPDLAGVHVPVPECECRGACRHPQAGHRVQRGDELFRHAVAEVLIVAVGAQVREGQHRDGPGRAARCGDAAARSLPEQHEAGGQNGGSRGVPDGPAGPPARRRDRRCRGQRVPERASRGKPVGRRLGERLERGPFDRGR